jgi:hypothetical protein
VKVYVRAAVWYPMFSADLEPLNKSTDGAVDVTDEWWARYERVLANFRSMQEELEKLGGGPP